LKEKLPRLLTFFSSGEELVDTLTAFVSISPCITPLSDWENDGVLKPSNEITYTQPKILKFTFILVSFLV
jgi:hypothetical protein